MKLQIELWKDNKVLRTVSESFKKHEIASHVKLGHQMIKYIKNPKTGWVWIAAPQIGINKRLIIVSLLHDWDDDNFSTVMMFNPIILEQSESTNIDNEWCLSLPWDRGKVARSDSIKLMYTNEKGQEKTIFLSMLAARIVQHEIDHLDGILFIDKLEKPWILKNS